MDSNQLYNYITKTYALDGTSQRLVKNILLLEDLQGSRNDVKRADLRFLLGDAFGIENWECNMYGSKADYDSLLGSLNRDEMELAVDQIHEHESLECSCDPGKDIGRYVCTAGAYMEMLLPQQDFIALIKFAVAESNAELQDWMKRQ